MSADCREPGLNTCFLERLGDWDVHKVAHKRIDPAIVLGIVVIAGRDLNDVNNAVGHLAECDAVVKSPAIFLMLVAADADLNDDAGTDFFSDCSEDLERELGTVLNGAAVFVCSCIPSRGQELGKEPSVTALHHDLIESRLDCAESRLGKITCNAGHIFFIHCRNMCAVFLVHLHRTDDFSGRRAVEKRLGKKSRMGQLHARVGAVSVDRVSELDPVFGGKDHP